MADFSKEVDDAFLDAGGSKILEACHENYLNGDRASIMEALICCALFQEVMPDWLARELLTLDEKLDRRQMKDINEFFNFEKKNIATHGKNKRIEQYEGKVLPELINHRLDGGNFSVACGLQGVADNTKVPRRTVEGVYAKNKDMLSKLPKNREKGAVQGYMNAKVGGSLLELFEYNLERKRK